MRIRVLFFGLLKDLAGRSEDQIEVAEGASLRQVFDTYATQIPRMKEMAGSIVLAHNQAFADPSTLVSDGDEVAFLPPVSGGTDEFLSKICDPEGHLFGLTRMPIDSQKWSRSLQQGRDGAVIVFEGIVRDNTKGRLTRFLDYECYEPMALQMMAKIGREIASEQRISRIAMIHRLGRLEIGEASVSIIVTSPHRQAAFDAALDGINRLKKLVPIWKKEYFADGEVWVEGEWDANAPVVA